MDQVRFPVWFCRVIRCLARQCLEDVRISGQCSRSITMALRSRPFIISPEAQTEVIPRPDWFYQEVRFMGQQHMAARPGELSSRSTLMAQHSRLFILSVQVQTDLIHTRG